MRSVGPVSFWWRWVAANAVGELIGLGGVAGAGYLFIALFGEPESIIHGIGTALFFVLAGSFEGYVLGLAQGKVLRLRIPTLEGWVKATVVGAVVAWALGMTPSMIMSFVQPATPEAPPDMSTGLRMALAAGLGMAAGPLLAFFQWRVLRNYLAKAAWWLPANALAWAVGMPVLFAGVHGADAMPSKALAVLAAAATIAAAGAVVGAIHGAVLLWLCRAAIHREAAR